MKILSLCLFVIIQWCAASVLGIYHHDIDWIRQHLASKSPYPTTRVPSVDTITKSYSLEQLQLVIRHGTRYPSDGDTKDIADILALLQTSKNTSALPWLKSYQNIYTPERSGMLSGLGQSEEYLHGRRVARSFPELIDAVMDNGDLALRFSSYTSSSERTAQSAMAFQLGVFQGRGQLSKAKQFVTPILTYARDNDTLIAIDDNCPAWRAQVHDNDATDLQADQYRLLAETSIADRLTMDLGINITTKDVDSIYTGCAFDVTHHDTVDTFCSLLSREDILTLEFREDLSYYYKYSYGNKLNSKVACALVQDLVKEIEAAAEDKDGYDKLSLKFGHTQTVLFLQTFLGLHQDPEPLVANLSKSAIDNRIFRTSKIATFASNVAFQMLRKNKSDKFVRILVSETPVKLTGCSDEVCPYEQFKAILEPLLKCDIQEICNE